ELYKLQKEPGELCLSFVRPLRTVSLGSNETGLDWCQEIIQQQSSANAAWKSASLSSYEVRLKDDKGYSWLAVLTHRQKENEVNIVLLTNAPFSDGNLLHAAMKVIEYRAFLGKTGRIVVASSHHKEENQEEISEFLMERLQKELQLFMETKMTDNCFK
ncbi:MAG: ABC transporter ATP-binding protein, partial [Priestia megaterium]